MAIATTPGIKIRCRKCNRPLTDILGDQESGYFVRPRGARSISGSDQSTWLRNPYGTINRLTLACHPKRCRRPTIPVKRETLERLAQEAVSRGQMEIFA